MEKLINERDEKLQESFRQLEQVKTIKEEFINPDSTIYLEELKFDVSEEDSQRKKKKKQKALNKKEAQDRRIKE